MMSGIHFLDSDSPVDGSQSYTQALLNEDSADESWSNVFWIQKRLIQAFPDAVIQVDDTRNDDQHLAVTIVTAQFSGKTRIACHQLVYAALDQMRNGRIHAMSLKTTA